MALSLENPNLVRQKVYAALGGGDNPSAHQGVYWAAARQFFRNWVSEGGNAHLQFVPFSEADADDADGTGIVDSACRVYMFYVNKRGTATTENHVKLFDNATVDTTTTDQHFSIMLEKAGQEALLVYTQDGISMANGVTVTQHTTSEGTSDGSDGGDGFVVIGAA